MKKLYITYLFTSLFFCMVCFFVGVRHGKRSMMPVTTFYFQRSIDGTNWQTVAYKPPVVTTNFTNSHFLKSITVK